MLSFSTVSQHLFSRLWKALRFMSVMLVASKFEKNMWNLFYLYTNKVSFCRLTVFAEIWQHFRSPQLVAKCSDLAASCYAPRPPLTDSRSRELLLRNVGAAPHIPVLSNRRMSAYRIASPPRTTFLPIYSSPYPKLEDPLRKRTGKSRLETNNSWIACR